MANVKTFTIEGRMPFHAGDDEDLIRLLGSLNLPGTAGAMTYSGKPVEFRSNAHGGRTAIYYFRLEGREALAWGWFERFRSLVRGVGGSITSDRVVDVEDNLVAPPRG